MTRKKTNRCQSCRWWDRSNNSRDISLDWGLCHFWGGRTGQRTPVGFIDGTFGHEPSGMDTCDFHNADPTTKSDAQLGGNMPAMMCEGQFPRDERRRDAQADRG